MKSRFPRATVLAVLVALAPAPPLLAATAVDDVLATVEGGSLELGLSQLTANDELDPGTAVQSVSPPAEGTLACVEDHCTYTPPPGFSGTDRFSYTLGDGAGPQATAEVRIQVSPLIQPVVGDWNGDGVTDLGWFQGLFLDLFFLELPSADETGGPTLAGYGCDRPAVPPDRTGWIPIAGDWFGNDGRSEIGIFDPVRREYLLYARAGDGGPWVVARRFRHPTPGQGGLPVAGNWDDDPEDETGLFLPDEHRFLLLTANRGDAQVLDITLTDLPAGDWAPVAGDWGADGWRPDRVGVWDAEARVLRLRDANTSGPTEVVDEIYDEGPGLLPFSGRWGHPVSIGFYDPAREGGRAQFVLYPCDFDPTCPEPVVGGRQPILRPPPEDPVITPCAGGR